MHLIIPKLKLKQKWTKYCVLAATGAYNADANSDNVIFVIKYTNSYVPDVTLSAKGNQKLSNLVSKGFDRSVY